jgi:SnoaL-like domain
MDRDQRIDETQAALDAALSEFAQGRAAPYQALWSQADDVTIFGGFGGHERGWSSVGPRLAWAATQFESGRWAIEPLSAEFGVDLGYTVTLEHGEALVAGQVEAQELRVTHVFRLEDDTWKIIHRHADPHTQTTSPAPT